MHDQSFTMLEYHELRALIRSFAQTPIGHARFDELAPLDDINELRSALDKVAECVTLRQRGLIWSFSQVYHPGESLLRLHIEGSSLQPLDILQLAKLCEQAMSARASILAERDSCPALWRIVEALPRELHSIIAHISNKILPTGELDDRASPELGHVRHEITRLRSSITRSLEVLMRHAEDAIQDELVTVRNDRFVVPVKSDHRGRIQGVAHGFSSSGATVFIEPMQTIDANNELQELREREEREIAKILFALTQELRSQLPAMEIAAEAIAELDFIGAKATFHQRFNCVVPEIEPEDPRENVGTAGRGTVSLAPSARSSTTSSATGTLVLIDARHPLLEENLRATGGSVVPITLSLDEKHNAMVISGANAGGKTVVLKTTGLLTLMGLSGLPVPARDARIPFYSSVLADIGDHQSLAANLSTFTSHVANISRMIEICKTPALVLLDEVGTGTDPEEGSALGVAVVDHFRRARSAHVMATTHYSGLKMYAANQQGVINASVEFDEKTLQPTYRLIVGVAGSSSGLEIARRFGIPHGIVQAAIAQVKDSSREATEYLRRIRREAEEAAGLREALEEERAVVAEKFAALDKQAERRERERQSAFERALQATVIEFEKRARELVSKIENRAERLKVEREAQRREAELKREAQRAAGAARSGGFGSMGASNAQTRAVRVVRDGKILEGASAFSSSGDERELLDEQPALARESGRDTLAASGSALKIGDRVRLRSFGSIGIVDQVKGDEAEVHVKSLRFREKLENLELIESAAAAAETVRATKLRESRGTEVKLAESGESANLELNVIGQTTDEAVDAVDKFLDKAFINNLSQVWIIHGHGTGALRRVIREFLQGHPHVARFSAAPTDQGGGGATVVELRQ